MERVTEFALGDERHPDRMGLGFFLGDEARPDLFGHIGDDEGFQAMLFMNADTGQGVAMMSNSQNGILLGDLLVENIASEYGWKNYTPSKRPRLAAGAVLMAIAQSKDTQAAFQKYWNLKEADDSRYAPDENTLLILGYGLLMANRPQEAIDAMKLEVQEYPGYWYAYDTLAEVYLLAGERQLSIQNYEISVELNPGNRNTIEKLKKLKELFGR